MSLTSYAIDTTEEDGPCALYLTHQDGENFAWLEVTYFDEGIVADTERVVISLTELARLGRVAQAILDGRDPSERNYDRKAEAA